MTTPDGCGRPDGGVRRSRTTLNVLRLKLSRATFSKETHNSNSGLSHTRSPPVASTQSATVANTSFGRSKTEFVGSAHQVPVLFDDLEASSKGVGVNTSTSGARKRSKTDSEGSGPNISISRLRGDEPYTPLIRPGHKRSTSQHATPESTDRDKKLPPLPPSPFLNHASPLEPGWICVDTASAIEKIMDSVKTPGTASSLPAGTVSPQRYPLKASTPSRSIVRPHEVPLPVSPPSHTNAYRGPLSSPSMVATATTVRSPHQKKRVDHLVDGSARATVVVPQTRRPRAQTLSHKPKITYQRTPEPAPMVDRKLVLRTDWSIRYPASDYFYYNAVKKIVLYLTAADRRHTSDDALSYFLWAYIRPALGTKAFFAAIGSIYREKQRRAGNNGLAGSDSFPRRLAELMTGWITKHWRASDHADKDVIRRFIQKSAGCLPQQWMNPLLLGLDGVDRSFALRQWPSRTLEKHHGVSQEVPSSQPPFSKWKFDPLCAFTLTFDTPDGRIEFACQLTLLCSEAWQSSAPGDILCYWVLRGDFCAQSTRTRTPMKECVVIADQILRWVAKSVYEASLSDVAARMTYFWIEISKILLEHRNFLAFLSIIKALSLDIVKLRWRSVLAHERLPPTPHSSRLRFIPSKEDPMIHRDRLVAWFDDQLSLWTNGRTDTYQDLVKIEDTIPTVPIIEYHKEDALQANTILCNWKNTVTMTLFEALRTVAVEAQMLERFHAAYPFTVREDLRRWMKEQLDHAQLYVLP